MKSSQKIPHFFIADNLPALRSSSTPVVAIPRPSARSDLRLCGIYAFKKERADSEYIELFHNRQRTQACLDDLSPVAFTQRYYLNRLAA
jgi:hypothetical protein